jgi:hypothetical protein
MMTVSLQEGRLLLADRQPRPHSGAGPAGFSGPVDCPECHGCGVIYDKALGRAGKFYLNCPTCLATGSAPTSRHSIDTVVATRAAKRLL